MSKNTVFSRKILKIGLKIAHSEPWVYEKCQYDQNFAPSTAETAKTAPSTGVLTQYQSATWYRYRTVQYRTVSQKIA